MRALLYLSLFICLSSPSSGFSQEEAAGEFFGMPVSMDNYRFAKTAVMIFGGSGSGAPQTPREMEDRVWEDLLLSYEAFRRDIVVTQEDLEKEITALLQGEKVAFDWKTDKAAYGQWVKERAKESAEAFENQLRHLLQIQKLKDQVRENLEPAVSEEEALQEYLNEYNTLSVEFVPFDDMNAAQSYYEKMKDPKLWVAEAKKNPKFAVRPGFVSLEFLIEVWKIPKDDAYAMLALETGSVYKPTPVYQGYGVFHTLEKKVAKREKFSEHRESYIDQVRARKQHEGLKEWIRQLKEEAHIKVSADGQ